MSKTIGTLSDLQLTVPSKGEQDWSDIMDAVHLAIANHNHTLNGTGRQIASGAIATGAVGTLKITDAAVTAAKIAANAITTDKILDGNVTTAKLADSSVTTAKLATDSVTNDKIANNAVGTDNVIDGAVTTAKILDANVTAAKLATNSVATTNIIDANVTAAKLATNSVGTSNIIDATITTAKLADDSVDDTKIRLRNNQYLTARNAANNADINVIRVNNLDQIELAADIAPGDNTISTAKIQNGAVTGDKINSISVLPVLNNYVVQNSGTIDPFIGGQINWRRVESNETVTIRPSFWGYVINTSGATRTISFTDGSTTVTGVSMANNSIRLVISADSNILVGPATTVLVGV